MGGMIETDADCLTVALHLAELGWHVFPVDYRGKRPLVKWGDDATTDTEQIVAWFAGRTRNIGIACGPSGLLVIDEDEYCALDDYANSIGEKVPDTYTVETSKGFHYYFRAPSGQVGNSEGALRSYGVNVRGNGGYVVGPGSTHEDGTRYRAHDETPLADCPRWLADALKRPGVDNTRDEFAIPERVWSVDSPIPSGQRHNELVSYAGRLRDKGLSYDEAVTLFRRRWEACAQPPDAPHEHSLETALGDLRDIYGRYPAGDGNGSDDKWWTEQAAKYVPLDWRKVWQETPDDIEWMVEPLIQRGQSVALFSTAKTGKSLLCLEVAAALASGREVLGNPARDPIPVLYVDLENTQQDIKDRLIDLDYGPDDLDNLNYLSFPNLPALDSERGGRDLLAVALAHHAELVIIDTVSRVIAGKENDADTFHALYRYAIVPLKAHSVSVLRLDHAGKDVTQGQRGSSAKESDVDAVWLLIAKTGDRLALKRKAERSPYGSPLVELVREPNPLRHRTVNDGGVPSIVTELVSQLNRLSVPLDAGRNVARMALADAGIKASNTALADAVKLRKLSLDLSGDRRPRRQPLRGRHDLSKTCPE
jgi:hypothetical protein